ncbi:SulP family inorganic anion transporter [Maridesulfovibrio sp.]|uniref:SulP family inorganic anion transporter n=1 Tax=Maridesulfovibrio sp. TaxID=2795000 RepID=UPI002A1871D9|nr:SulP family inorganic anion transporter [Maridesulfovibrio sp.]
MIKDLGKNIRGDLFGGVTAGIIALPLALAFGVASGAGAAAGLYGAIILGFTAALLGGTVTQISGPTGPMTVVVAATLTSFSGDMGSVCAVVALGGIMQAFFGLFRLGAFVRFIPYPVISGFMSGIGVIIIILQIDPILGVKASSSPAAALMGLSGALAAASTPSIMLAVATMAIVFLVPARITRIIPSPLIALLLTTAAAWFFRLPVMTIGEIPSSLPDFSLPDFDLHNWSYIAGTALALAALGSIDSLLTSLVADSLTKDRHDSNRELIGQGIGNMLCGFFGALPGAGATMRTVVNVKAGGRTRLSGMIHAFVLLAVILGAGPAAEHIPLAALAGILVKVGVDILDYRMLKMIRRIPRSDLAVMLTVFGVTVFVDLVLAVAVGVTLAAMMTTWRIASQTQISIFESDRCSVMKRREKDIQEQSSFRIRVVSINGPFFFGTSSQMSDKVEKLVGTRIVVINCMDVPFVDVSAVFALNEMVEKLRSANITVLMAANEAISRRLGDMGIVKLVGKENMFLSHGSALQVAMLALNEEDERAAFKGPLAEV